MQNKIIKYKKILFQKLELNYNCKIIRGDLEDDEIDIVIKDNNFKNNLNKLILYLKNENFILFKETSKIHFYKYYNSKLIHIDLSLNQNYLKKYFNIIFKKSLIEDNLESKFFRYLITLRKDRLFFLENNYNLIFNIENYFEQIFRSIPTKKDFKLIIKRNHFYLIKYLKLKFYFQYLINRIIEIRNNFNKGYLISILGPDGVGKSTIINILSNDFGKKIYMGGKEFKFESIYIKFENKIYLKPFIILSRIVENYFRYIKIYLWRIKSNKVFIDRYPKYELITSINDSKFNLILFYLFYLFYPRPDKYIILFESSKKIHLRKDELSELELDKVQKKLKHIFINNKKSIFIKNSNLDETLNKILNILLK